MLASRHYHFKFAHPVEQLWAVVSDTPRWGEASGFPKYQASEELQPDGTVKVVGHIEIAGIGVSWEEPPVNWIAERWYEQQRIFTRGPFNRMTTRATLEDRGDASELDLELEFDSRNFIGTLLARRMLAAFEDKVRKLLDTADRLVHAQQPELFESSYQPPAEALRRGQRLVEELDASSYAHGLAQRLLDHINESQEVDLWTMRPLALARRWQTDGRDTVELFLQSVRAGLLESRWEVLCPRCRIGKSASANISDLPRGVHCDACNIDFESDFGSNVELSFSPSPSIRAVESGFFCRSGPGVTPHIKGQYTLAPAARGSLPLVLKPGDYRIRTLEAGDEVEFTWQDGHFPRIRVDGDQVAIDGDSNPGLIDMVNAGDRPRTVVIEEQSWLRDVLTAEHATTLQAFRDLFSEQVLRPGDEVSIRQVSFLFSDLVGSSSLFARIGDARAYHLVREHFAELGEIVRRNRGSIVKTVGDGIHAAFLRPDDALRAATEMQLAMPDFNQRLETRDLAIRVGLNAGSSIAVTLNGRLDYYGEAVNLAARLEGTGDAGCITMSKAFGEDPAVDDMLTGYQLQQQRITLKGYDTAIEVYQINPSTEHAKAAG